MTPLGFQGPRRQRGVIGLLGALVMMLVAVCIALALDTGRLYMEKRNLQRVADLAALEAMSKVTLPDGADLVIKAQAAAARNGFVDGVNRQSISAELGGLTVEDGRRVFVSSGADSDSARVVAEKVVPTSLIANMAKLVDSDIPATVTLSADAVASRTGMASFTLGSGLLALDADNSSLLGPLLGGLLGSDIELSAVDAEGLLDASVSLLELAKAMPLIGLEVASSVDELLETELSVAELAELMAEVLRRQQGEGNLTNVDLELLNIVQEKAGIDLNDIELSEVLRVDAPTGERDEALNTKLRLGDLLGVGLIAANGDKAIQLGISTGELGGLNDGISGLDSITDLDISATISKKPQLAIGPPGKLDTPEGDQHWKTEVTTPQVSLNVGASLNLGLVSLDLGLKLDAGSGKAALESLRTGGEMDILVRPVLANLSLGSKDDLDNDFGEPLSPASVKILNADDASLVNIQVSAEARAAEDGDMVVRTTDQRLSFSPPYPSMESTVLASGDGLQGLLASLGNNLEIDINILDSDSEVDSGDCDFFSPDCIIDGIVDTVVDAVVEPVVKALLNVLVPLIGNIGTLVLQPLLDLLGIDLNTLEVTVLDASSTQVELVK